MVADRAHHAFFFGGLKNVVVFVIATDRAHFAEATFANVVKALLEQKELQFRRHHSVKAQGLEPCNLLLQNSAWGMGDGLMCVVVQNITENHCRALQPGHQPDRAEIWFHDIIAVSRLPTAGRIAFRRRHLQICRQQIVTAMGFFVRVLNEVNCMKPLTHQAALHVHQTGQDGINCAVCNKGFQVVKAQNTGHGQVHFKKKAKSSELAWG